MADIIKNSQVKWNIQTSDGLVIGALADQASTGGNIFKTLATAPYNEYIEIDPRSKNTGGRNIADQWYLLDSLGANPTTHLGGCIYFTANPAIQPIDWVQYRNPVIGNIFGNSWQCTLLTGAGSYPPHSNDLNDFGIYKPDSANEFYQHNPSANLWTMGTGCAPLLTDTTDEQQIIDLIQGQVDSIQNGFWPENKFYVTRIMTNQRDYNPVFFQKVQIIIDSLALIPATQLTWATISETFEAFEVWQLASGLDYSQWLCGQITTRTEDVSRSTSNRVYPNPSYGVFNFNFLDNKPRLVKIYDALGRLIFMPSDAGNTVDLSHLTPGIYYCMMDHYPALKLIRL